jgi:hypothetical protein
MALYEVKVITTDDKTLTQYFTNFAAAQDYAHAAESHSFVKDVIYPSTYGVALNRGLNITYALETLELFV